MKNWFGKWQGSNQLSISNCRVIKIRKIMKLADSAKTIDFGLSITREVLMESWQSITFSGSVFHFLANYGNLIYTWWTWSIHIFQPKGFDPNDGENGHNHPNASSKARLPEIFMTRTWILKNLIPLNVDIPPQLSTGLSSLQSRYPFLFINMLGSYRFPFRFFAFFFHFCAWWLFRVVAVINVSTIKFITFDKFTNYCNND